MNPRAFVFDAYGTLFDVHSAIGRHAGRVGKNAPEVSALWRTTQIEYSWLRSLMGRYTDFWQVTGDALDFALETHGIRNPPLREDLMKAYLSLTAYPDAAPTLATLHARGAQLAILSNGSPAMLHDAVTSAGLQGAFDAVLSVEEVGIFKPDPRVYQLAIDRLGLASASEACFVSSNYWDAAGAASFGYRVAWVNRRSLPRDRLGASPEWEISSLAKLPALFE